MNGDLSHATLGNLIFRGGICIWAASYPGNAASVRSGAASFLGSLSRGSGMKYIIADFLRSENDEHISALTWSPDGRYPEKCQMFYLFLLHVFWNIIVFISFFLSFCHDMLL